MVYSPRRRPQLVAHKGGSAEHPENSLAAFVAARAIPAVDMVEIDVCATADGHPVVLHGPRLDGTTTGSGLVAKWPAEVVLGLGLRESSGGLSASELVPDLGSALDAIGPDLAVNCDIKDPSIVDTVVAELRERAMLERAVLSGLTAGPARRTLRRHPDVSVLLNLTRLDKVVARRRRLRKVWFTTVHRPLLRGRVVALNIAHVWVDADLVAAVHRLGAQVWVFTVDNQDRVDALVAMGVDSITTNWPADLVVRCADA